MTVTIRPMVAADYPQWAPLWQAYLTFYASSVRDEVTDTTFARLTDSKNTERAAFVAQIDKDIVGFVHHITHAHNWHLNDVMYLQDLFVADGMRGQGVARALIDRVYKLADESGTPNVYWMTQEFNHPARALYDKVATLTPFVKYQRPV